MSKAKKLVPELRFPEFKGEWEPKILENVGEFIGGGTPDTSISEYWNGNIQWYTPSEIKDKFLTKSNRTITEIGLKNSSAKLLPPGSLLITTRATIGEVAISSSECATNQGFQSLIVNNSEINEFWYYWIINHKSLLKKISSGSTFSEIGKNEIKRVSAVSPKRNEQQKIADCISSLDELITAHTEKLQLLKDHKKGLMQNLFPHKDEKVPKFRFPEFRNEGDWEKMKIGDIAKVTAGGTPESTNPEYWNGNIPWMNSGELNNKRIYAVSNFITEKGLKESSTKMIPKKCVLIGLAGQGKTRGTAAINYIELCTNQSIGSIHPNTEIFDSEFLYQKIDSMYDTLRYLSAGDGGRGGLNLQIIKEIEILLPKMQEQQKIASTLSTLDELITTQTEKIEQLNQHKKGLMQGLFPKI